MTTPDEQPPHDECLASLYRRMPQQEPSPVLDARIRKQARRELRRHYWPPLAAAAVILLGITIALRLFDTHTLSPELHTPPQTGDTRSSEAAADAQSGSPRPAVVGLEGKAAQPAPAESAMQRFQATQPHKAQARPTPMSDQEPDRAAGSSPPYSARRENFTPPAAETAELAGQESPCGQADLLDNPDRLAWQQRIRELRATGQTQAADCLAEQFAQRFGDD